MEMVNILLIEDNDGDARLVRESLIDCKICNSLTHVDSGEKALRYLHHQGEYLSVRLPDLILLDLNLPGMSGEEVLAAIKKDESIKTIPICILSASSADVDIIKSYNLHANCYVVKPLDLDQFVSVVNSIADFWFTIVKLPS